MSDNRFGGGGSRSVNCFKTRGRSTNRDRPVHMDGGKEKAFRSSSKTQPAAKAVTYSGGCTADSTGTNCRLVKVMKFTALSGNGLTAVWKKNSLLSHSEVVKCKWTI